MQSSIPTVWQGHAQWEPVESMRSSATSPPFLQVYHTNIFRKYYSSGFHPPLLQLYAPFPLYPCVEWEKQNLSLSFWFSCTVQEEGLGVGEKLWLQSPAGTCVTNPRKNIWRRKTSRWTSLGQLWFQQFIQRSKKWMWICRTLCASLLCTTNMNYFSKKSQFSYSPLQT